MGILTLFLQFDSEKLSDLKEVVDFGVGYRSALTETIRLNEMTLLKVIELGGDVMSKGSESIEPAGNGQLNEVTLDFTTILQAIFAEGTDYTKKSVETRLALVEKLLGAKSLETVIQIQSEYAKTAYADFVAQATKMGELHSNLAKAAFKPAEQAIAAMQGTK
jgi:hypothetical protein